MRLHKEGNKFLLLAFILLAVLNIVFFLIFNTIVAIALLVVAVAFFIFLLSFFRVPPREFLKSDNSVVSPADGKVVVIEKVHEKEFFNEERIQVSVFMSPLNVHVNWFPINGVVDHEEYRPGKFLVAWHPKSSELNEQTIVVLKTLQGTKLLVKQIAGALAKRIVCYAKKDQQIKQGEELGFIKFGSRVDVLLPVDAKIKVELNQVVTGGVTELAEL